MATSKMRRFPEFARREKARFYRMARRSATECAAILDIVQELGR